MITVQFKGIDRMVNDLDRLRRKALPHAARETLNVIAKTAESLWHDEMSRKFTLRNKWTQGSTRVVMARGLEIGQMRAVLGSLAQDHEGRPQRYVALQETGGAVEHTGAHRAIPAPAAAGLSPGSTTRPKQVSATYGRRLAKLKLLKPVAKSRKQANRIALAYAKSRGFHFALLRRKRGGYGIFWVGGGKRQLKTRLLWDLSRTSVRVRTRPTLSIAVKRVEPSVEHIMQSALLTQLRYWRIAGY